MTLWIQLIFLKTFKTSSRCLKMRAESFSLLRLEMVNLTFRTKMEKHIRILMLQLGIYKQFRMLVKKIVGEVKR